MRRIIALFCLGFFVLSLMAQTTQQLQKAFSPEEQKKFDEQRARLYQWDSFKFLLGNWKIQGETANAGFEVQQSLDGKVLVISNSEPRIMSAPEGKRSANYRSVTYVYLEGLTLRATLYDNQGRTLTFDLEAAPQKIALIGTDAPKTRIEFAETKDGMISIASQPGAPAFAKGGGKIQAVRVSR